MVLKQCPHCDQQVPVACKACYCGYVFFQRKVFHTKPVPTSSSDTNSKHRRTGRVKRERPDYYSASEFETHLRRLSTKSERCGSASSPPKSPRKKHRGRPRKRGRPPLDKGHKAKVKGERETTEPKDAQEEDVYSNVSAENAFVYSVVLADINRKLQSQWNGPNTVCKKETEIDNSQYVFCDETS